MLTAPTRTPSDLLRSLTWFSRALQVNAVRSGQHLLGQRTPLGLKFCFDRGNTYNSRCDAVRVAMALGPSLRLIRPVSGFSPSGALTLAPDTTSDLPDHRLAFMTSREYVRGGIE